MVEQRKTREADARKKVWRPAHKLETPPPPDGYKYRWVRRELRGNEDKQNVLGRTRQYYEPVSSDEVDMKVQTLDDGKHAGTVVTGDLMLMKVPEEIAQQRTEYYDEKTQDQQRAVDAELAKSDSSVMPVHSDRRTKVTVGSSKPKFE